MLYGAGRVLVGRYKSTCSKQSGRVTSPIFPCGQVCGARDPRQAAPLRFDRCRAARTGHAGLIPAPSPLPS